MNEFFRPQHQRTRLKKFFRKPGLYIILFALCGALAIEWAVMFLVQWNEGETAAQKAEVLLEAVDIRPPAATATASPQADEADSALPAGSAAPLEHEGYSVIARQDIDALDLHLSVLEETTEEVLKSLRVLLYRGCSRPGRQYGYHRP